MTLRPSVLFVLLGVILAVLVVVAVFLPRGPEKLAMRESTKVAGPELRTCLATGLGLGVWQGPPVAMRASKFGLRVAVSDNGKGRQVGLFTAGGQALSSGQTAAVRACLDPK
ncbi:hypothetical protein [Novosphingobium sp.]|uniref:hypothetical protein n=1 Tax=Novosphingobium sp. TaxID=1874826 RepID=UPI003D111C50